jgi:flagellar hook-associated protein 3 FlgL
MRISSTMMTGNYLSQLNRSYESQTKLMEQSDGNSLHRPSDNAVNYSKYLRYENNLTENNQYKDNVSTALSWMKNSDAALVSITGNFSTIVQKTNEAATSTNSSSDMAAIAQEMMSQVQEVVSDANAQVGGRYLFSGQKDLVQPFTLSTSQVDRGLAKTLNDTQKSFFSDTDNAGDLSQMITMTGNDGNTYYANTKTGAVYTQQFVESGYKDKIAAGQTTVSAADSVGTISDAGGTGINISTHFKNTGELSSNSSYSITVNGSPVSLSYATVKQQIATYNGDANYISMVTQNGPTQPTSDTVNVTGKDVFGSDIFDDAASNNTTSGSAAINNMLTVQAQTQASKYNWLSTDGVTLANNSYNVVNSAQTKLAARQQAYTDTQTMLTTQNQTITGDVTDVSGTDVAALAVKMMTAQTIYNMSLSVGSKILPPSLSDYLS